MPAIRITSIAAVGGHARLVHCELSDPPAGHVRVRALFSGVSAGTEQLMLAASAASESAEPRPLGYQLVGEIESAAEDLKDRFSPGDRVACYGGPYVHHASYINVPKHLVVGVPSGCDPVAVSFCGLGAIALHAFRTADLRIGETAAVIGLGMLGNLIAQIARAAGCRVAGCDRVEKRRAVAGSVGIPAFGELGELACRVRELAGGHEADAVFLAVGNAGSELVAEAVRMVRPMGKVLIVGTARAEIPREGLFSKEAMILVPRAAGPGRYDPAYERDGRDYPYGYVRWTEGRNLEEFVRLVGIGSVRTTPLITDTVPPEGGAHRMITEAPEEHLGIVVRWPEATAAAFR